MGVKNVNTLGAPCSSRRSLYYGGTSFTRKCHNLILWSWGGGGGEFNGGLLIYDTRSLISTPIY